MTGNEGRLYESTHPVEEEQPEATRESALAIVHPPELAQVVPLRSGLVLGRAPASDANALVHATVSRRHAQVRRGMGGLWTVADEGSRNGTFVEGQRISTATPLTEQSVVRFGDVLAVVFETAAGGFYDDLAVPGTGYAIARVRELLAAAAPEHATVLILGETGTGKERLARELHERSGRSGPYVVLNCAELAPQLIESQLFGHERGAFTGATTAKPGLFAAAHQGTLFLDEIGELPLELQPKLLRVLQEGEVRPLGGIALRSVDVRVVAATHRPLPLLVDQGLFRRDLYARLSLWELQLPPLRERRQDILRWIGALALQPFRLTADAAERLLLHPWPENLRGLQRLVHRLSHEGDATPIGRRRLVELMPELTTDGTSHDGVTATMPAAEARPRSGPTREDFLAVYEAHGRSVRATAKHFGRDRRQIYRWLERFGIPREPGDT